MSNAQGKSRKSLIIGVVAAVVVLAVLLVLLTQCTGGDTGATTVPSTTEASDVVETYDLYWNIDRKLYDGMSEAGMSSRTPEDDGYFHVRFFKDGQIVTLKVADRKTVNALEVQDLMGLVFDDNGIVVDILTLDQMPCEQVAWQFYVQSAGGNLIKTNSSASLNGMEVLIETTENTGIWDMTGLSGEVGCVAEPIPYDRVLAVANSAGEVTHVFLYERSNYMRTHEAECEHCGKTVEWSEWTKTTSIPNMTGHFQLMTDITTTGQTSMPEDAKICLDLNGKRIDGKANARVYSLHNPSTELAIMDTSEEKTGTIAAHGKGDQGMCVWLRYGVVYLYDGILDGSDATSIKNGTTVALQGNTFMYMHGGEIIGGTSTYLKNETTGKYTNGLGGALAVANKGKFVMNDGVIRDGYAQAIVTKYSKGEPSTYERGIGGNVFLSSGSVFEMNGGTVKNGKAGNLGGNFYLDGTAELTMKGGTISGGTITGKGRNGGNIYVSSKATFTMNGGRVTGGSSRNCAGNIYLNGKVVMTGGYVGGGRIISWSTGKLVPDSASRNVFIVNGDFRMYGGVIDGGVQAIDTNAEKVTTRVSLTTYATIASETAPNLTISSGGSGVEVHVGTMRDSAKIGVTTSVGLFSQITAEDNLDNFYSDVEGADVVYYQERLGLGKVGCLCGETEQHLPGCDGTVLFWAPWTSTNSLPTTTGNYYLLGDVKCGQTNIAADAVINLDLNGHRVDGNSGTRIYSLHNRVENVAEDGTTTYTYPAHLTITDTSEGRKGVMASHGSATHQGSIVWLRYGSLTLIAGTMDASDYQLWTDWNAGKDGLYGTTDDTTTAKAGAAISVPSGRTFTMYGGTVIGGETVDIELTRTNTIPVPEDAPEGTEPTREEVKKTTKASHGGSVDVSGTMYMYGGTIRDGVSGSTAGNLRINSSGKVYMYGGTVTGGTSTGNGGNIQLSGLLELHGGTIENGWSKNTAGNIHVSPGKLVMTGGYIGGGKTGSGGSTTADHANIFCVNGKMDLTGGEIAGHVRIINYNTQGAEGGSVVNISGNPVITGGTVNVVLAPQDDKTAAKDNDDGKTPTMPILNIVGPMTEGANVVVSQSTGGIDFAVGSGYDVSEADGKAFTLLGTDVTAAADTENNSLFFGRFNCLCGKEEHTFGCMEVNGGKELKWYAWNSTTSLPTSGNWYLTGKVTGSGTTSVATNATLNLDLNGYNIERANRAYRIYNANAVANATLTITNTSETEAAIKTTTASGTDQGIAVWIAGSENGTFNLLDGVVLDGSTYTVKNSYSNGSTSEKNGGTVSIGSGATFNMYGGTIIGAEGEAPSTQSYAPNGGAVAVSGVMYMYGGTIRDGKTANTGGNLLVTGDVYMSGGTISGGSANAGGNVFVHRSGELHMSGDAQIQGGTTTGNSGSIRVDGKMTMTDNALVSGGKAGTNSGNILVNFITSGGKTYYGSLAMSGNAKVENGVASDGNGGNIRMLTGTTFTMTDNAVVSGGTCSGNKGDEPTGGNIAIEGGTATLSGNAKVVDGKSYHTGGNIRVSAGAELTIQDNAQISGGQMTNSKSDTSKTMTEAHSSSNIFVVNGKLNILGGTITGNVSVVNSNANNLAVITLSGKPVIKEGASGYGMTIGKVSSATALPTVNIVGALTGEAGSIGIYTGTTGKFAEGKDYTLTDTDAAVFHATQLGVAVDCGVRREDNTLVIGKGECLCGLEEHIRACLDLWNGEARTWTAWTSTASLPTTTGNYYLTGDVDFDSQQKIAKNANVVLDLNGHTVTNDNGQRMYATWESGGSLTITDKSEAQTGKLVGSGDAVDQGLVWVRYGTFNLVAGTIDASGFNLRNVWDTAKKAIAEKNGGAIDVDGNTTFNMYGGTVIGANCIRNTVTVDGVEKDIYAPNGGTVASSGTVNMYGGTITGGNANEGGNVYVSGGKFTMYGGEITNGTASNRGGNIRIGASGTMILKEGAVVSGGEATGGTGGNFLVQGKLTIEGGEIKDGVSKGNGGNIIIAGGTVDLKSGTVSGGWSKNVTGNVHIDGGIFNMSGGTVKGGKTGASATTTTNHANIQSVNGTWNFSGGTVDGNCQITNYNCDGLTGGATTVLSGSATVNGKLYLVALDDKADDGKTPAQPLLEVAADFDGKVPVSVKTDGVITTAAVTEAQEKCFTSVDSSKNIYHLTADMGVDAADVGKLYIGQIHCECGKLGGDHEDFCDGKDYIWTAWSGKVMPSESGHYYLTGNLTVNTALALSKSVDIVIDLNGYTINSSAGRMYSMRNTADHAQVKSIIFTNTYSGQRSGKRATISVSGSGDQGRIVWLNGEAKTVVAYNLDVDMSEATVSNVKSRDGLAFATTAENGTSNDKADGSLVWATNYIKLYDVKLTGGNTHTNGNLIAGAGATNILLEDCYLTSGNASHLNGSEETEYGGKGGAIYMSNNGSLTLTDTVITGCTATMGGGGVYMDGSSKLTINGDTKIYGNTVNGVENNLYIAEGATLLIGSLGSNAQVGLGGVTGDSLSTDVTYAEMEAAFTADSDEQQLVHNDSGLSLQDASAHIHCVCGGTLSNGEKLSDGTYHYCNDLVYTPYAMKSGNITADTNGYLTGDLTLTGQPGTGIYTLNLCLNGHNVTTSANARMFRTYNGATGNGKIAVTTCVDDSEVEGKANTISQKAGTLSDNGDGGIFWITDGGTLELYAGTLDASMYTLKPNASDSPKHGCAVKIETNSSFVMYGGTVIGGKTQKGTSNNSEGAAIFLRGPMTMYGGKIVGGETVGSGGSVFVFTEGSFKMYGGTITGGKAANNGGNIFSQGKEVLIAGGTIEKGTAGARGGNVYFGTNGGTISGGTISGGEGKDGGNIANATGITVTMTGGTVTGGNCTSAGGNVWLMGPLKMSGGTIEKGTSKGNTNHTGANINMNGSGALEMTGGTIKGRVCTAVSGVKVDLSGSAKIYETDTTNNLYIWGMNITVGELSDDAKIGLLILEDDQVGNVATVASGVTIYPAQFPVHDLQLTNSSTRSFAVQQDGTSLKIVETTN